MKGVTQYFKNVRKIYRSIVLKKQKQTLMPVSKTFMLNLLKAQFCYILVKFLYMFDRVGYIICAFHLNILKQEDVYLSRNNRICNFSLQNQQIGVVENEFHVFLKVKNITILEMLFYIDGIVDVVILAVLSIKEMILTKIKHFEYIFVFLCMYSNHVYFCNLLNATLQFVSLYHDTVLWVGGLFLQTKLMSCSACPDEILYKFYRNRYHMCLLSYFVERLVLLL